MDSSHLQKLTCTILPATEELKNVILSTTEMGQPSFQASNALIYLTYGAFLIAGLYIAYLLRKQTKGQFLASNGTQKG
ncbi:hypothetical protein CIHG_02250 [Coccidioides immitis H538.4]|uniref:Uncharacterized protein n=1 Tax=Coccidioides immitis H538.4 TaxID=396776 RepID=A0A0J8RH18_COCIT|nr:hypothetical protein CIHG_02250 [Coccidioides immitis H538.4]